MSVAVPSSAEYWHMGATATRLGTSIGPSGKRVEADAARG